MNRIVKLRRAGGERGVYELGEVLSRELILVLLVFRLMLPVDHETVAQPVDVLRLLQFWDAGGQHKREERDQQLAVLPHDVVCLAGDPDKLLKLFGSLVPQHVGKVGRHHERRPLALDAKLGLEVSEKVTEIDVEEVAGLRKHDVVVVAIADSHDVGGDAVAGEGHAKRLHRLLVLRLGVRVVFAQEEGHGLLAERSGRATRKPLGDVGGGVRVEDNLEEADLVAGRDASVGGETQVKTLALPSALHDPNDLQRQRVLP
mmetsp:Transcript_33536/g.75901  ORF Transcript_33536/g.75901 Transcript_33536/m.75901 type:complete len:259 (-) Transcript_33536:597-1373(-)